MWQGHSGIQILRGQVRGLLHEPAHAPTSTAAVESMHDLTQCWPLMWTATHELALLGDVEQSRSLQHVSNARGLFDAMVDVRLIKPPGAPNIGLQLDIHLPLLTAAHLRPSEIHFATTLGYICQIAQAHVYDSEGKFAKANELKVPEVHVLDEELESGMALCASADCPSCDRMSERQLPAAIQHVAFVRTEQLNE
eukprot:CAMPEP_0174712134 /NCGR_PEP_ID=MMETSP1094-20130205/13227_1 /TAXON_ID=156173 /ORGANISM="Chrysochromulina brevifilum, Strain UTEX LB 985" /LENGTH=194 /DNA_ID=CAMNT_0015911161 /DNA_START=243 /DNA_END=827 /DNA_ORIENTATION=-